MCIDVVVDVVIDVVDVVDVIDGNVNELRRTVFRQAHSHTAGAGRDGVAVDGGQRLELVGEIGIGRHGCRLGLRLCVLESVELFSNQFAKVKYAAPGAVIGPGCEESY